MQIIINENEIMEALNEWAAKQVVLEPGSKIKVEFTAGRGANGTRATIDIIKDEAAPEAGTNTMQEGFAIPSKDEAVVKKAIGQVEDIIDKEAAKPLEEDPKNEPEPEKETVTEEPTEGQDDVESIFGPNQ